MEYNYCMIPELTPEQRDALAHCDSHVLKIVDPLTNATYVIMPCDVYERFRAVFEAGDLDIREAYPLMDAVARAAGWDDAAEDIYDDLDPNRPA